MSPYGFLLHSQQVAYCQQALSVTQQRYRFRQMSSPAQLLKTDLIELFHKLFRGKKLAEFTEWKTAKLIYNLDFIEMSDTNPKVIDSFHFLK